MFGHTPNTGQLFDRELHVLLVRTFLGLRLETLAENKDAKILDDLGLPFKKNQQVTN